MNRIIKKIIPSQMVDMGGHFIDQPLPVADVTQIDPFLLIHHWKQVLKPGKNQNELGVGPHPHRGFSPVTFVFRGSIRHQDSIGNDSVIKAGGTQWMHAGRGIVHSERPGKELAFEGGVSEFIQFWVNTPAEYKMEEPYYLPLTAKETPTIYKKRGSQIGVVAGNFEGVEGPAKIYSPQTLLRVNAIKEDSFSMSLPQSYNVIVYLLDGEVMIGDCTVVAKDMVWLDKNGDEISFKIAEDSRFIVLSGEPIEEPVLSYGPFVMNYREEVQQAMLDYQNGKMGNLVETFD